MQGDKAENIAIFRYAFGARENVPSSARLK
jgi:hypothetical protein